MLGISFKTVKILTIRIFVVNPKVPKFYSAARQQQQSLGEFEEAFVSFAKDSLQKVGEVAFQHV